MTSRQPPSGRSCCFRASKHASWAGLKLAPLHRLFAARLQEGDGISPTAIREILLLRELDHEHIVKLTAVHINRCTWAGFEQAVSTLWSSQPCTAASGACV